MWLLCSTTYQINSISLAWHSMSASNLLFLALGCLLVPFKHATLQTVWIPCYYKHAEWLLKQFSFCNIWQFGWSPSVLGSQFIFPSDSWNTALLLRVEQLLSAVFFCPSTQHTPISTTGWQLQWCVWGLRRTVPRGRIWSAGDSNSPPLENMLFFSPLLRITNIKCWDRAEEQRPSP